MIDRYKLVVSRFTTELEGELDRSLRSYVLTEVEIYSTESIDNQDGSYNLLYKSKVVGATQIKQGDKAVKGKSKRSQSQKFRYAVMGLGEKLGHDQEQFYDNYMNKLIANPEAVWEFLKNI